MAVRDGAHQATGRWWEDLVAAHANVADRDPSQTGVKSQTLRSLWQGSPVKPDAIRNRWWVPQIAEAEAYAEGRASDESRDGKTDTSGAHADLSEIHTSSQSTGPRENGPYRPSQSRTPGTSAVKKQKGSEECAVRAFKMKTVKSDHKTGCSPRDALLGHHSKRKNTLGDHATRKAQQPAASVERVSTHLHDGQISMDLW